MTQMSRQKLVHQQELPVPGLSSSPNCISEIKTLIPRDSRFGITDIQFLHHSHQVEDLQVRTKLVHQRFLTAALPNPVTSSSEPLAADCLMSRKRFGERIPEHPEGH